jgi:hypothetical protein
MTPDRAYWAGHCSAFDDATLLRFLAAVEASRSRYDAALAAAQAEAERRNLIEKRPPSPGAKQ